MFRLSKKKEEGGRGLLTLLECQGCNFAPPRVQLSYHGIELEKGSVGSASTSVTIKKIAIELYILDGVQLKCKREKSVF